MSIKFDKFDGIKVNGQEFHDLENILIGNNQKKVELSDDFKALSKNFEQSSTEEKPDDVQPESLSERAANYLKNNIPALFEKTKKEVELSDDFKALPKSLEQSSNAEPGLLAKVGQFFKIEEITDASEGIEANRKEKNYMSNENEKLQARIKQERAEISQQVLNRFGVKKEYQEFSSSDNAVIDLYKKYHHDIEQIAAIYGQAAGKKAHAITNWIGMKTIGNAGFNQTNTEENRAQRFQERSALNAGIAVEFLTKNSIRIAHALPYIATPILAAAVITAFIVIVALSLPVMYIIGSPLYCIDKLRELFNSTRDSQQTKPEQLSKDAPQTKKKKVQFEDKTVEIAPFEKEAVAKQLATVVAEKLLAPKKASMKARILSSVLRDIKSISNAFAEIGPELHFVSN